MRGSLRFVAAAGIALQLVGLAADVVLHARDATLAGREGMLTAGNPGHLLIAIGLALTVFAAVGVLLARPLPDWRRRAVSGGAAIAVLTLAGGAAALSARGHAHEHDLAGAAHHPAAEGVAVSWERLHEIDRMLATAREAAEKYRDLDVARADGYRQQSTLIRGQGAHYFNLELLTAGVIDVTRPTVLVYDRAGDGGMELAGVGWAVLRETEDQPPPEAFAPLGRWHHHRAEDLCVKVRGDGEEFVGNYSSAEECAATGGLFMQRGP